VSNSLVRLEQISKVYRMGEVEVHALRQVSLSIGHGELVAIMGASGSGKSTTLNVIGTLDRPSTGRYFLAEEAVESLPEEELARLRNLKIGFVFQAFHLLPSGAGARSTRWRAWVWRNEPVICRVSCPGGNSSG
jgi:putative ABC transport system ATP-binding protein